MILEVYLALDKSLKILEAKEDNMRTKFNIYKQRISYIMKYIIMSDQED